MRMKFSLLAMLGLLVVLAVGQPVQASDADRLPATPTLNDGKKWRLGYYEGGQYPDYEIILKATVRGLISLGWMEPLELPPENDPTAGGFWNYLVEHAVSDYLEFLPDGYHSAGNFDRDLRVTTREALIRRLKQNGDIDLMIAMGTWAGQDLANDNHAVPVVVASTSDPIGSGIIKSAEDSGFDHVHAKVEPDRYARQVELFHDTIGFTRLGVVYEDSAEGRTFAAIDAIENTAAERGFEIVRCLAPFNDVTLQEAEARVIACYEELSRSADAVYLTVHRGLNDNSLPHAIEPLIAAEVPSFSMLGETEVRQGVLMSVAQGNYIYVGQFHAETIGRIFNGAKPRDLSQTWLAPAKIALNLKTAELIGYDPPVDILMASDEIFQTISTR
ncbi:ABC transporter substrate-binding protein [Telmatospirillum sp. J64-1]|uniref:ABC transporter substrate-binding protein n=1 Tax=Telmatospirillum sp. J64-1 TaxID=2502183 RepID=UPI001C8F3143|nr:ABC transporter substrate binding protein [Telmatospirillum sp. J64-1]